VIAVPIDRNDATKVLNIESTDAAAMKAILTFAFVNTHYYQKLKVIGCSIYALTNGMYVMGPNRSMFYVPTFFGRVLRCSIAVVVATTPDSEDTRYQALLALLSLEEVEVIGSHQFTFSSMVHVIEVLQNILPSLLFFTVSPFHKVLCQCVQQYFIFPLYFYDFYQPIHHRSSSERYRM
jgi:hypothetical protein